MKIEFQTKYDVGQEMFYITEGQDAKIEKHVCNECGAQHTNIIKDYVVVRGTISHIVANGSANYDHELFLDGAIRLSYILDSGWYVQENQLFLTEEDAKNHINDPKSRACG